MTVLNYYFIRTFIYLLPKTHYKVPNATFSGDNWLPTVIPSRSIWNYLASHFWIQVYIIQSGACSQAPQDMAPWKI